LYPDNEELISLAVGSATTVGDEEVVANLLTFCAAPAKNIRGLENPLLIAIRKRRISIAKLILEASVKQGWSFENDVMQEYLETVRMQSKKSARNHTGGIIRLHKQGFTGTYVVGKQTYEYPPLDKEELIWELVEEFVVEMNKHAAMEELFIGYGANSDLLENIDIIAELEAVWDEEQTDLETDST
jgi:hypothetical protein